MAEYVLKGKTADFPVDLEGVNRMRLEMAHTLLAESGMNVMVLHKSLTKYNLQRVQ